MLKRISFKAVLLGGVVDVGSSIIFGIPLAIYVVSRLDLAHIAKDQVGPALTAAMNASLPLYAAQLAIGSGCSVLGGFVAAQIAKHDELLNGALSSFLCIATGVYSVSFGHDSHSRLVQALLFLASPVFGTLGGYVSLRKRGHSQNARGLAGGAV